MLSSSSGSEGPPAADVQPHKDDEKPQGLCPLWHISSGGEAEPPSLLRWARQRQRLRCRRQAGQVILGSLQEQGSVQQSGVMQAETKKKCSVVRPNHRLSSLVCLL